MLAAKDEGSREPRTGFVYVLINRSMPGLVKIGLTRDKTEFRARRLSGHTGVPTDFEIAWDELVSDCARVERRVHDRLGEHRIHERREFFRVPLRSAIAVLQEEATSFRIDSLDISKTDVLPALESRFRRWLRNDLVGAHIGQVDNVVYFESTFQPKVDSSDLVVKRVDLDCIYDDVTDDEPALTPTRPVVANARLFLEWDTYTLWYFLPIFSEEVEEYFRDLERSRVDGRHRFPFRP